MLQSANVESVTDKYGGAPERLNRILGKFFVLRAGLDIPHHTAGFADGRKMGGVASGQVLFNSGYWKGVEVSKALLLSNFLQKLP